MVLVNDIGMKILKQGIKVLSFTNEEEKNHDNIAVAAGILKYKFKSFVLCSTIGLALRCFY